jgi:hypothetical protein
MPRGLELALGALVVRAIQPRVFDENVEAVEERPRGRAAAGFGLSYVRDSSLLVQSVNSKPMPESDLTHDYGGNENWRFRLKSRHQMDRYVREVPRYTKGGGIGPGRCAAPSNSFRHM